MALIDKAKLSKLLMMTTSDNDGEALNAMRMANKLIKDAGYDWNKLIGGHQQQRQPMPPPRPPSKPMGRGVFDPPASRFTDKEIPRMLASLRRDSKGSFSDFLDSINKQWEDKGYLTERQYEVLTDAYEREK